MVAIFLGVVGIQRLEINHMPEYLTEDYEIIEMYVKSAFRYRCHDSKYAPENSNGAVVRKERKPEEVSYFAHLSGSQMI